MKLALFDFDGTLTKKDSLIGFLKFYTGSLFFFSRCILCLPVLISWFLKLTDASTAKEKILSIYFKGQSESLLKQRGIDFIDSLFLKNAFNTTVLNHLKKHIQEKDHCVIISASPDIWIRPFAEKMGVNYICTNLLFSEGIYTGHFATKNCKGAEKVDRLLKDINRNAFDYVTAYGNSKDDAEMMALADNKIWIK